MIRATVKGLTARKLRTFLTTLAIVLGVGFVSGAYILTDTLTDAADQLKEASYGKLDGVVTGRTSFDVDTFEVITAPPTVPEKLVDQVAGLDEVGLAVGSINDFALLVGKDGKVIGGEGAPPFAAGLDVERPGFERLSPFRMDKGRYPRNDREIAVDAGSVEKEGWELGDKVAVSGGGGRREFTLTGVSLTGDVKSIGNATQAIFDLRTAQRLFGKEGEVDLVSLAAADGVSPSQLAAAVRPTLPETAELGDAFEVDPYQFEGLTTFLSFIRSFLLGFAGVALFVGAFIIFNTLSITVAQRSREFAMLRTIGATRRQILRSVVLETFLVGVVASIVGLVAGLGIASGLTALFVAFGIDLPRSETVIAARTIIAGLGVGVGVTMVAGLVPAIRATRVAPVGALREGAVLPPSRAARYTPVFAVLTTLIGVALVAYGMLAADVDVVGRLVTIVGGCLVLFIGVALFSSKLVPPLARVLGAPARRIGGSAGALAQRNAMRNPGRTASTAAALMIGLALVTFVAVLGEGLKNSYGGSLDQQLQADYLVTAQDDFSPVDAKVAEAVAAAPGATAVSSLREDAARIFGKQERVNAIEPRTAAQVLDFNWEEGSDAVLSSLGRDGAVVTRKYADEHGLAVGKRFAVTAPTGKKLDLTVRGIDDPPDFNPLGLAAVLISTEAYDAAFEQERNRYTFVASEGGVSAATRRPVAEALARFPEAKVSTKAEFRKSGEEQLATFLNLLYAMLALSVIISLFGIVNTLVLAVFERTRELGMLRAVGMTRRQVRRMIRHESIVTALIGAALGIPLGIFLAALVTTALRDEGLTFGLPVGALIAFAIVAILAGIVAAILPARRASRLDVLEALQYE